MRSVYRRWFGRRWSEIAMYSKVSSNDEGGIRSIRWFQPVAKRRWCSEESNAAVSWRKNYTRMDGRRSERVARSSRCARGAVEDITRRRVRYTRAGPRGKIMPEEVGICLFFSLSLMTTNASTDDCVRFIARVERAGRQSRKAPFSSSSSSFEEPRRRSWLKYKHKLRKLRARRIENYCSLSSKYILSHLNRKSPFLLSAYFISLLCMFYKRVLSV